MRAPTYKLPYRTKLIVSAAKSRGSREVYYLDHDNAKDNFPVHVEYAHTGCENFFEWAHVELANYDGGCLWDEQLEKDKEMVKPVIEAARNILEAEDKYQGYGDAVVSAEEVNRTVTLSEDAVPGGEGYPDNNPKTMLGVSKCPLHLVPPIVEAQMAMAWKDGAAKYGPFNWRKEKISSSVYYAAAKRHMLAWYDGEDKASDSGVHHLAHAMACLGMVLDGQTMGKLNDDRPPPGAVAEFLEECIEKN